MRGGQPAFSQDISRKMGDQAPSKCDGNIVNSLSDAVLHFWLPRLSTRSLALGLQTAVLRLRPPKLENRTLDSGSSDLGLARSG